MRKNILILVKKNHEFASYIMNIYDLLNMMHRSELSQNLLNFFWK